MSIIFNQAVKHGKSQFFPGVPVAFEDEDAAPYFLAAGWADETDQSPLHTYSKGEIDIDPETVFGSGEKIGQRVMAKPTSTGKGK